MGPKMLHLLKGYLEKKQNPSTDPNMCMVNVVDDDCGAERSKNYGVGVLAVGLCWYASARVNRSLGAKASKCSK